MCADRTAPIFGTARRLIGLAAALLWLSLSSSAFGHSGASADATTRQGHGPVAGIAHHHGGGHSHIPGSRHDHQSCPVAACSPVTMAPVEGSFVRAPSLRRATSVPSGSTPHGIDLVGDPPVPRPGA
jgi:hypothetical protein